MTPTLYSFRRCPYAMRARLALAYCNIKCELVEVSLKAKPPQMLELSPKGTVPVLHLKASNEVLEESLDIMLWALKQNPKQNWLPNDPLKQTEIFQWIELCDHTFKPWLDKYKYADRFPEYDSNHYFEEARVFLGPLESSLRSKNCLGGDSYNLADMAILPFVRQFASVDRALFDETYPKLVPWLDSFLDSDQFKQIMVKYSVWHEGQPKEYFP